MEDYDMNMNDGNADPSAANGAAARDDASHHHQEIVQITSGDMVTPEAIRAATNNPALQYVLDSFNQSLRANLKLAQDAMASHRLVEESSTKFKASARGDQLAAMAGECRKMSLKGIIEDSATIMKEAKAMVDGTNVAISGLMKGTELTLKRILQHGEDISNHEERLAKLEQCCLELQKENAELKAMLEGLIGNKAGGRKQVNQIRAQLAEVSLKEGQDDSMRD